MIFEWYQFLENTSYYARIVESVLMRIHLKNLVWDLKLTELFTAEDDKRMKIFQGLSTKMLLSFCKALLTLSNPKDTFLKMIRESF